MRDVIKHAHIWFGMRDVIIPVLQTEWNGTEHNSQHADPIRTDNSQHTLRHLWYL